MQNVPPNQSADRIGNGIHVLVVDDDLSTLRGIERILKNRGFTVTTQSDGRKVIGILTQQNVDVVLLDMMLPGIHGMDLVARIRSINSYSQIVMMSAFGEMESAVAALKAGACDFLSKPFESAEALSLSVRKAAEQGRLINRTQELKIDVEERKTGDEIVASSAIMKEILTMVDTIARTDSTVLLQGESGTGKEVIARRIHSRSMRAAGPFIPVNCSAIPESLLESELFGHVRGAFTGATSHREGLFEAAGSGTLLLDEIGDLPPHFQVKLLRTLQDGEIRRVGSSEPVRVNTRVIAATNADLQQAMSQGAFRPDLFYRISVITLPIPPLRERSEDIPVLSAHFLKRHRHRIGKPLTTMSPEASNLLQQYPWPGNVRELENAIERAVVIARNPIITPSDLPPSVRERSTSELAEKSDIQGSFREAKKHAVEQFERDYALQILASTGGNVSEAARYAKMDRSNFRRILRKHGLRYSE